MSRPSLLVLAASAAALAVGCAHCDTCDDFPAPCTGPYCGYPYQSSYPIAGGPMVGPVDGAADRRADRLEPGPRRPERPAAGPRRPTRRPRHLGRRQLGLPPAPTEPEGGAPDLLDLPPMNDSPFGGAPPID